MEMRARDVPRVAPPWARQVGAWLRDVVDLCLPPLCAACRAATEAGSLCGDCGRMIDLLAAAPACDLCGQSLAYRHAPCPHCINRGIPHYDRVERLGAFDPPLRTLVHQFKYHRRWTVGEFLADRLFKEDRVESLLLDTDGLLPVPLHAMRRLSRGYNQAEVIADRLAKTSGLPVIDAVCRTRDTQTQTHLHSRMQRLANLKGAFRLTNADAIEGRRIVVIDDVMTTGATLQTLARTLRHARPASLSVLVLAVANARHGPAATS